MSLTGTKKSMGGNIGIHKYHAKDPGGKSFKVLY